MRTLAERHGVHPTKTLGQNFVHDGGTVRRIARLADIQPGEQVLEIGPGLGSLTLALLEAGAHLTAIEIDPVLADALPGTVGDVDPEGAQRLRVITADALQLTEALIAPDQPTALVANLPYNVAVPVVLTALAQLPSVERMLVMVQAEVGERLAAPPGSRTYGAPSAKLAWYATAELAGRISRTVFWPEPRVDSVLVRITRTTPPRQAEAPSRHEVFDVVNAAFSQRRKTLRAALSTWAGSPAQAEAILRRAGVDPTLRGERLTIDDFARVAAAR